MRRCRFLPLITLLLVVSLSIMYFRWQQRHAEKQTLLGAQLHFAREDWTPSLVITDQDDLRLLGRAFRQAASRSASLPNQEPPIYRLQLHFAGDQRDYLIMHDLRIFDDKLDNEILPESSCLRLLNDYLDGLKKHQFGELVHWSEASQLIPRYATFFITDLETGLRFRAQRRAGSQHADIQPLTREDTATLKQIYGGAWSWDRRAVVVEHAGRRIAASMNGMPHGAGALPNGFPGHHCLHFMGSTTHGSDNADPVHQLMVQRAAGQLCEYLDQLAPDRLQGLALEMAGQGDATVVSLLIDNLGDRRHAQLASEIRDIRIWSSQVGEAKHGEQRGHYAVSVFFRNDSREYRANVSITSRYHGDLGKWLVDPDYLYQLLAARD